MSDARAEILGRIGKALRGGPVSGARAAELEARLAAHPRGLIPARAQTLDRAARLALFIAMAEEVDATVARVASADEVPDAVARYLAERNLPARAVVTPDPKLAGLPWQGTALEIRSGVATDSDPVGVSACFAAIAETGTLMLVSGPASPTRNNFLPDTHIAIVRGDQVLGIYEEAWDRLRAAGAMPRTVNFITGPSRTGDIAQKLELGAHGPRRLHIVLVEHGA
jgi:L-lactate dehydrogenase complex protein LldG